MQIPVVIVERSASEAFESTGYVWFIAMVAAIGGLLFGYDWVVIGGARQFYEVYFHLTSSTLVGWANSCALVGCLLGSLMAGYCADRFGRRPVLQAAAVLFAVSSALTGWAYSFESFIFWRIAGGTAIGLSSNISPLYIAEISPAKIRGRLVSLNQFAIVIGILLAQILNWLIARPVVAGLSEMAFLHSWNVQVAWRWMFGVVVIPATVFAGALLFIPESPQWLLTHDREAEAEDVLERIGGHSSGETEPVSTTNIALAGDRVGTASLRELVAPGVWRIVLVGIALAVLQQWTGINTLFNYAAEVYRKAGYSENDIFLNIVITGAINLIFTALAMLLVDRIGRRPLMLFGCAGIGFSHLLCAWAYHAHWSSVAVLILTLSAIACYALTLAPVVWVLISEMFPNRIRSQGVSVAVSALWVASFVLTYSFPSLNRGLGTAGIFTGYGVICLLGCVLVAFCVPETKGQTLEQIESGRATRTSAHHMSS